MAIFNRKLLNQTIEDPSPALFCAPYCNELHNPEGICPQICIDSCLQICKIAENLIPPPEPYDYAIIDSEAKKSHVGLSLFLTISISVLATIFFLLTCYTIYKLYKSWCKSRRRRFLSRGGGEQSVDDDFVVVDEDRGPEIDHPIWYIRTVGLQPSVVSAITVVKYKKGDGLVEGTDCSVCLSEFREDEMLRLLPKCNHAFHVPCIDTWLRSHTNCPMCRAGIVSNVAVLPLQEVVVVESSGVVVAEEENRGGESERREEGVRELGIEGGDVDDLREDEGKIRMMRRSVSVDFLSTNAGVRLDRNSDSQLSEVKESGVGEERVDVNRLVGSSSNERPSYVKRSLSCSAKV